MRMRSSKGLITTQIGVITRRNGREVKDDQEVERREKHEEAFAASEINQIRIWDQKPNRMTKTNQSSHR